MPRKPLEVIRGLASFLVLWTGAIMAIRLQLVFPRSVLVWLSQSPDPQRAVVAFGALVSSGILALVRLGIELPPIKPLVASEKVRTYLSGLPLWVMGGIFALATISLLVVFPACQAPVTILFSVEGRPDNLYPGGLLIASPGETVAITVHPIQADAIPSCRWQYVGQAFETMSSGYGCEIKVKVAERPGNGLLTLQVSQDFCEQSAVFSLGIQVVSP